MLVRGEFGGLNKGFGLGFVRGLVVMEDEREVDLGSAKADYIGLKIEVSLRLGCCGCETKRCDDAISRRS